MQKSKAVVRGTVFAGLLIIIAVSGWISRCQDEPEQEPMVIEFPLVRVPGVLATYSGPVEFIVPPGQWLVVVLDPDSESVVLPASGTWMAAVVIEPGDSVTLDRDGDGELISLVSPED